MADPDLKAFVKMPWTKDRIYVLRAKLRLTQSEFAHRLGVTFVSVNRWENGNAIPRGLSIKVLNDLEKESNGV